jgi:hypothetical protein
MTPPKDGKDSRGEMRRRHEAIIRSGVLGRLRSEGRLVMTLALCWADYKSCQFRMSARGAASVAGIQPTTVRRGLEQLLAAGVIEAGKPERGKRQLYRFRPPQKTAHEPWAGGAHPVRPPAHTPCAPRAHPVRTPRTPCAHTAHTPCADRAQAVRPIPQLSSRVPQEPVRTDDPALTGRASSEEPHDVPCQTPPERSP